MIWLRCVGICGGIWVTYNEAGMWISYFRERRAYRAEQRRDS